MAALPDCPRRAPDRTVKPRKARYIHRPIIAVDRNHVMLEDGELFPFADLPKIIATQPSSIIVAINMGMVVRFLDNELRDDPSWQFRAVPTQHTTWGTVGKRKIHTKECIVTYFGFRGANKRKGHYHYPLSPQSFLQKTLKDIYPGNEPNIIRLMEWGKDVRRFLEKHSLNLSPTSGGVAAQFLKDKKFYPEARRKVPKKTNEFARRQLPGNYYELFHAKDNYHRFKATYLDQNAAHHSAAAKIEFPDANTLYRRGRYSTLDDQSYARAGTPKFERLIKEKGLFYLAYEAPRFGKNDFPLPQLDSNRHGYGRGYFYSNELPYLASLKVRIRHIIACWTSPDIDQGLNKFAEWAKDEIKQAEPKSRKWLKPTLLSTYGVLAAKPKVMESGYRDCKNGIDNQYPLGSGFIDVQSKSCKKPREPNFANVIHRGMIEAQTRIESLSMAKQLAHEGHTILAIYADSVFVTAGKDLPLLPSLWKIEQHLTHLQFQDATHFSSLEISKQPGIPHDFRKRARHLPPRPSPKRRKRRFIRGLS